MKESIPIPALREEVMDKMTAYRESIMLKCLDIINADGDEIYIGKEIDGRHDVLNIGIEHLRADDAVLQDVQRWTALYMSDPLRASFETIDDTVYIKISGLQSTKPKS